MKRRPISKLIASALTAVMLFSSCGTSATEAPAAGTQAPVATTPATQTPATATPATQTPATQTPAAPKIVTIAMTNAWDTMMPINTNSNYTRLIIDQIYDSLSMATRMGEQVPRLADSWEVNADSTAVTFHLNKNVTWHDGQKFTADDVVFTYQLYSDPTVNALSRYSMQYIAGTDESGAETSADSIAVKALDDYTVEMTMKSAMFHETLVNEIDSIVILPKHVFEGKTAEELNGPDVWANPIGTGPFIYDSEINGERMEFVKNENYFLGTPDIDRLVVRIVPTANLLAGLISGEIDIVAGGALGAILLDDWEMAQEQTNLTTSAIETSSYQMLIMNTKKPYMTEKVRQAFSMAINRDALVTSLLKGQGTPVITPICPLSSYYDSSVEIWYDPVEAKKMLDEENFPYDTELLFYVPSGNTTRERAAALIQQDLQKLGVKVKIEMVDFPTLMNNMREELHDFGIIGSGGSLDPAESRQMINPDSPVNFARLTDYALSDLLDAGTASLTFETRLPYFKEYQQLVKQTSAMAYLYTTNSLMAYNKRLSNITVEDFGSLNWSAWEWKVTE